MRTGNSPACPDPNTATWTMRVSRDWWTASAAACEQVWTGHRQQRKHGWYRYNTQQCPGQHVGPDIARMSLTIAVVTSLCCLYYTVGNGGADRGCRACLLGAAELVPLKLSLCGATALKQEAVLALLRLPS